MVEGALYDLTGYRPSVFETLHVGECARRAVMGLFGGVSGGGLSHALSGRMSNRPSSAHHSHAFYLPVDTDKDGLIDRLAILAPTGLETDECRALEQLRHIVYRRSPADRNQRFEVNGSFDQVTVDRIDLRFCGFFTSDDIRSTPWIASLVGPSTEWRSSTVFVLARHPKRYRDGRPKLNAEGRQIDGIEDQLLREVNERAVVLGNPPVSLVKVSRLEALRLPDGRTRSWRAFAHRRMFGGGRSSEFTCGVSFQCDQPIRGPIALGYGCHFGLGLFEHSKPNPEAVLSHSNQDSPSSSTTG